MNTKTIRHSLRLSMLLASILILGACSSIVRKDDPSVVDKKAVERWNFLIAGKADKAYDYLSPGFQKTKSRDVYTAEMSNRPVHWKKVQFIGKDCDDKVCHVRLLVDFSININIGTAHEANSVDVIKEDWLNADGHWYYLPPAMGATSPK